MQENLFYTVLPGAIEAYRKSIESHLLQIEVKTLLKNGITEVCYICFPFMLFQFCSYVYAAIFD